MDLRGKRLLILGGNMFTSAIKQFAEEYGVQIIAVSNDPDAEIFKIADERYVLSSTDEDAMKDFIKTHDIDGVYMGTSEPVISVACKYINELGYPCYCNRKQWDLFQNKINFKQACINAGLPVVPRYFIDEDNMCMPSGEYPVITKPADGCGSSGFSVCYNDEELKEGYFLAQSVSPSNTVIVEKYVNNNALAALYTISEGKAVFSGLEKKIPVCYEKHGSYVMGIILFQSSALDEFRQLFDAKVQALIDYSGIKEGNIWFEIFHDGRNYYFNEAGFRYGGSITIYPVDYFYGINQLAADIYYALTGRSKIFNYISLIPTKIPRGKNYCTYPIHCLPGKIVDIIGTDILLSRSYIVAMPFQRNIGDIITDSGSVKQVIANVHFVYETQEQLKKNITEIHQYFKVLDEQGNDLVVRKIDLENCDLSL